MATSRLRLLLLLSCALFSCSCNRTPAAGSSSPASEEVSPALEAKSSALPATGRKVIRSVELTLEVASPSAAEAAVTKVVERLGGYV